MVFCCRCVQCVIDEQLRKMDKSLEVMNALETAAISAEERLSVTRASTRASSVRLSRAGELQPTTTTTRTSASVSSAAAAAGQDMEEAMLNQQIKSMRHEK